MGPFVMGGLTREQSGGERLPHGVRDEMLHGEAMGQAVNLDGAGEPNGDTGRELKESVCVGVLMALHPTPASRA